MHCTDIHHNLRGCKSACLDITNSSAELKDNGQQHVLLLWLRFLSDSATNFFVDKFQHEQSSWHHLYNEKLS